MGDSVARTPFPRNGKKEPQRSQLEEQARKHTFALKQRSTQEKELQDCRSTLANGTLLFEAGEGKTQSRESREERGKTIGYSSQVAFRRVLGSSFFINPILEPRSKSILSMTLFLAFEASPIDLRSRDIGKRMSIRTSPQRQRSAASLS
ncbi:unnamed protein product [Cochlearia groenlandica]